MSELDDIYNARLGNKPEERKQFLEDLDKLWEKYPDMRFGQLLENYIFGHHTERKCCIFYVEDKDVIENLRNKLKECTTNSF